MKVAFITTIRHNVGDDFVRDGIKYIIETTLKNKPKYYHIHKHVPATVRFGFGNLRSLKWSERIERFIPMSLLADRISAADIVIQSGAPMYWYHSPKIASFNNEWYGPLIEKRVNSGSKKPILNVGVGSCQNYHDTVQTLTESRKFTRFIKDFYNICKLTIVRDHLSLELLTKLGLKAIKLPCPSIFSSDYNDENIGVRKSEYVVLNFMEGAGHFDFRNQIDKEKWQSTFIELYHYIKKKENIVFACHNKKELNITRHLFPDASTFYSQNYQDYIQFYSKAKFGIVNRVHAMFQMASHGIPSFVIGSDSRAKMASEIGLKSTYVEDCTVEDLISDFELLREKQSTYRIEVKELKEKALNGYVNEISKYL